MIGRGTASGHLAMLLFSALVAGSFSLGARAAPHLAPEVLNALRFTLAAAVLGAIVWLRGGVPRAALRAPWRYLVLGAVFSSYFVLMFHGLKTAEPVPAAAVYTLTPAMAALFGWALMRQRMTPRLALALALGAAGALWVIFRADPAALMAFDLGRGEAIYFVGCVAHAAYTPLARYLNRGEGVVVFGFCVTTAMAALLWLWAIPYLPGIAWAALPASVWTGIVYLAIFTSAITVLLLQHATLLLPSAKVMAYTYLTPSWVVIWQVALGDSLPPLKVLAGVSLTVAAVLLLLRREGEGPVPA